MKKLTVLFMSVVLAFALASCGGTSGGDAGKQDAGKTISVKMEIDYPDGSDAADVEDADVEIPEGGSVMDALNAYADASGCEILVDESGGSPYVTSIGGVAATDTAGWVYEVNDEEIMKTADDCTLKAGDEVSWSFTEWTE